MKTCSCLIQNKRSFLDVAGEILQDGKINRVYPSYDFFNFKVGSKT